MVPPAPFPWCISPPPSVPPSRAWSVLSQDLRGIVRRPPALALSHSLQCSALSFPAALAASDTGLRYTSGSVWALLPWVKSLKLSRQQPGTIIGVPACVSLLSVITVLCFRCPKPENHHFKGILSYCLVALGRRLNSIPVASSWLEAEFSKSLLKHVCVCAHALPRGLISINLRLWYERLYRKEW